MMATKRSTAAWTRVAERGLELDVLEIDSVDARSWCFVWSGRVVVQALSGGISWTHPQAGRDLPAGGVLIADKLAARLRICAASGSSFRVLFEHAADGPGGMSPSRASAEAPHHHGAPLAIDAQPIDLFRAVADVVSQAPRTGRVRGPVGRACEYIERNLGGDFDLATLSAAVGVDPCHLCRVFQRTVGLPPYRFRAHLRVARARALLAAGIDGAVVAYTVGFCDQSHLTRCFKELTGTTPGAYAKACRAAWRAASAA